MRWLIVRLALVVTLAAAALHADPPDPGGGLANVVEDLTPQLGGDLDLNGNDFLDATGNVMTIDNNCFFFENFSQSFNIHFGGGTTPMLGWKNNEASSSCGNLNSVGMSTNSFNNINLSTIGFDKPVNLRPNNTIALTATNDFTSSVVKIIEDTTQGVTDDSFIVEQSDGTDIFTVDSTSVDISTTLTLTTDLAVAHGGTGASTLTDGGILLGSGTSAITALGVATNGQIPIGDGATDPVLSTITGTANEITVTNGAGSITIDIPASPTLDGTNFSGIPTSALLTEVRSVWFSPNEIASDGAQCANSAEVTIGSWGKKATIICTDNDASIFTGSYGMPDGWDAGTLTFELQYIQDAAETLILNTDVSARCVGAGETPAAYGTEIAIDDAAVTGTDAIDFTTSAAVTAAGTCAAGDFIQWQIAIDATGTTTAMATLNFVGVKMEYTTNIGD